MSTERHRPERRRRIIVDKKLQMKMNLALTGYVYVYLVLFALIVNLGPIATVITGGDGDQEYIEAVARLKIFMKVFLPPLGFAFVCMALHGFFFSQRLAGPIARMKNAIKSVAQGDLRQDLHIRETDYFQDLCAEVNALVGTLRDEFVRFRNLSCELAEEGEALAATGDLPEDAQAKLLAIANSSAKLRQLTDGYKLGQPVQAPEEPAPAPEEEMVESA